MPSPSFSVYDCCKIRNECKDLNTTYFSLPTSAQTIAINLINRSGINVLKYHSNHSHTDEQCGLNPSPHLSSPPIPHTKTIYHLMQSTINKNGDLSKIQLIDSHYRSDEGKRKKEKKINSEITSSCLQYTFILNLYFENQITKSTTRAKKTNHYEH